MWAAVLIFYLYVYNKHKNMLYGKVCGNTMTISNELGVVLKRKIYMKRKNIYSTHLMNIPNKCSRCTTYSHSKSIFNDWNMTLNHRPPLGVSENSDQLERSKS